MPSKRVSWAKNSSLFEVFEYSSEEPNRLERVESKESPASQFIDTSSESDSNPPNSCSPSLGVFIGGTLGAVVFLFLAPFLPIGGLVFVAAVIGGGLLGWIVGKLAECFSSAGSAQSPENQEAAREYHNRCLLSMLEHDKEIVASIPEPVFAASESEIGSRFFFEGSSFISQEATQLASSGLTLKNGL